MRWKWWASRALAGTAFCAAVPMRGGDSMGSVAIVLIVAFLILSLALHEAAHAWVAYKCGDSTARDLGRLTLNPIPHIDLMFTIVIPGMLLAMGSPFIIGGAKPVPVNPMRLRHPLRDMMLVAIAGPLSNLLIACVFGFALRMALNDGWYPNAASSFDDREVQLLPVVLTQSMVVNVMLAVFNMLPIPPLDGSRVMTWLLPPPLRAGYVRLESFGILLVILVLNFIPVVSPWLQYTLSSTIDTLVRAIKHITGVFA